MSAETWELVGGDLWYRVLWGFRAPGAYTSSEHLLSSGGEADFYVDFDLVVRDPGRADEVVRLFLQKIFEVKDRDPVHILAFVEKEGNTVGALSAALAISIGAQLPHIVVRLRKQARSERVKLKSARGAEIERRLEGRNIALVSDHATRGTELKLAVDSLKFFGGKVTRAFLFSICPDTFDFGWFEAEGVTVHGLYSVPRDLEDSGITPQKIAAGAAG